jgi:hypothetical protein
LLRGVVDNGDQGEALAGPQGQLLMAAPIQMQQFAEAGARLATAPMASPGAVFGHEPGALQRIAKAHAVLTPGDLMEVTDVEALVPLTV